MASGSTRLAKSQPHQKKTDRKRSRAGEELDTSYRRDLRLGYLVHDVSRLRRTAFDQLVRPHGVTRAQWWVIAFLARQDGASQTQLANILDLGKAGLGSLLDRLEAGQWVERRPDPIDRRTKRIFLTRKSARLLEWLRGVERSFNDRILTDLSPEERTELFRLLSKLKESLTAMNRNGARAGEASEE